MFLGGFLCAPHWLVSQACLPPSLRMSMGSTTTEMERVVRRSGVLACGLAAVVLDFALPPPSYAVDASLPPASVEPTDGAALPTRTPPLFRVRTHPGDAALRERRASRRLIEPEATGSLRPTYRLVSITLEVMRMIAKE